MKLILTREDRWPHSLIQQRSWRTSVLDTALGPGGNTSLHKTKIPLLPFSAGDEGLHLEYIRICQTAEWVTPDYFENYMVLLEEGDNGKTQCDI